MTNMEWAWFAIVLVILPVIYVLGVEYWKKRSDKDE